MPTNQVAHQPAVFHLWTAEGSTNHMHIYVKPILPHKVCTVMNENTKLIPSDS